MARKAPLQHRDDLPPVIPCAHETCGESAMCRVKTPTGWAKLCLTHYDAYYREQGRKAMREYGLERKEGVSHAEWKATVMEAWKELSKKSVVGKRWDEAA